MTRPRSFGRLLLALLTNRATLAYSQAPTFITVALVCVRLFDPAGSEAIPWWFIPVFFVYYATALLYVNARLLTGAWSVNKWADRLLLFSTPGAVFYGLIAHLAPDYFMVPIVGVLAAGLPLLGVGKNRLWLLWFAGFCVTYLAFTLSGPPDFATSDNLRTSSDLLAERPTAFTLSLAAAGLMLFWLMRTSSHVGKLNERAARNLIQARKSRRELEQVNRELNRKRARMDTELRIARRIQEGILPGTERFADSERLAVAARYMALDGIGGDYYDFAHPSKNCYGFFIADVSGHGVPAALVTTMTKVAFSNHSRSVGAYPEQVLGAINAEMYNFLGDLDHYLTACYLLVDLDRGIASIASGGHTPALIHRRSTGTLQEWTAASSFFLGVEPDFQYTAQEMRLVGRDRIILYTDGLSETQNAAHEFYGERRFEEFLLERANADGEQLVQGLMDDLQEFAGGLTPADDIAVLCIDYFETL